MTVNFPDLKEVIKIYSRKGARRPLLELERGEPSRDKVTISEEARRKALEFLAKNLKTEKGE